MAEKTNRIIYFDYLRVFAVFAVIILHTEADYLWDDIGTARFLVFDAYSSATRWCVPVFVMISGALFLDPARDIPMGKLYKKNLLRLVSAFAFWSFLYALVDYFEGIRLRQVVYNMIRGHYHLWYLFMLSGLYLVVPILRKVTESRRMTEYFLRIWFLFTLCLQSVIYLAGFVGASFSELFSKVADFLWFRVAGGYSGYFVIGYYLHHYELTKKNRIILYILGLLGFSLSFVLPVIYYEIKGFPNCNFYENLTVNVFFLSIAVFIFFKYHFNHGSTHALIRTLSDCSFGIYLVHLLIAEFADKHLRFNVLVCNPALSIPLIALCVFIVSFLITFLIKKIPVFGRYVV